MNEIIFFFHLITIIIGTIIALRLGKSSLTAFICLQSILSNLLVAKQMTLFGFDVTCSDVFAVGELIGLNMLQEYFGKQAATKSIIINFALLLFYTGMTQIHLWYTPNIFDTTHAAFSTIFELMPRLTISSLATYGIVQFIDMNLYAYLHKLFRGNYFTLRSALSLSISQLIDTILFSYLALYNIVGSLWHIIFVSYCIKLIIIALSAPLLALTKKLIRKPHESV